MTAFTQFKKLCGAIALIAVSTSCGSVVRQGRSGVYLVMDQLLAQSGGKTGGDKMNTLQADVLTMVTSPEPCSTTAPCATVFSDLGYVTLRALQKNVTSTGPSSNSEVTINRYHVSFRRADGRNTPGLDVPYGYDGAVTGTTLNGKLELQFELVRHVTKMESPIVELSVNPAVITTIAEVTFYGRDQVGNDVSVSGTIQVDFGNFGDK